MDSQNNNQCVNLTKELNYCRDPNNNSCIKTQINYINKEMGIDYIFCQDESYNCRLLNYN